MKDYLSIVGDLIDADEAAELANVNKATILKAMNDRELIAIDGIWKGKKTTREWVNRWIASKVNVDPDTAGGK